MEYQELCLKSIDEFEVPKYNLGTYKVYTPNYVRYYIDGLLHREGGPAHIYVGRVTRTEKYYHMNERHRDDGPAHIEYDIRGEKLIVRSTEYLQRNLFHRLNEPARIFYNALGEKMDIQYWVNGELHNERGPAVIYGPRQDFHREEKYYLCGKRYPKEEWEKQIETKLYW